MHSERETIRLIRDAVKRETLIEPFTAAEVNLAIGIDYAGVFLPKHRVGNHGFKGKLNTEHFAQVKHGFYQLKRFHFHPHEHWMASADPTHLPVDLLRPFPPEEMKVWKVGKAVGNTRNNDASLVEPLRENEASTTTLSLFE
jgi:hypothetical protein